MRRDPYGYDSYDRGGRSLPTGWIIGAVIALVVIGGAYWFFVGYWADASSRVWQWFTRKFLAGGFFPSWFNPIHFTMWTWLFIAIGLFIAAWFVYDSRGRSTAFIATMVAGTMVAGLSVYVWAIGLNNHSGSYADGTVFVVEDPSNTPQSLKRLVDDSTASGTDGCDLYAYNDMPGCIQQGALDFEWDSRQASATGARTVIKRSGGAVQNTTLLNDSLTYVYGQGENGVWTAIRDGKKREGVYSVLSYDGTGNVQTCKFTDDNDLDKGFNASWGHNLADDIADHFPDLFFDGGDRYGYCDGDKPVIVIPVKERVTFKTRKTYRAAGVLTITGSPSGAPIYQHDTDVEQGEYPGPVYPASLAKEQRESMSMIAGILDGMGMFGNFGYETTNVATQSGNASEYQLRDKKTGRVYWVTPMKARSSDSQVLAAYSVIPADEVSMGSLNEQRIYVLPDDDLRAVNLEDLEARTKQALVEADPGFYAADGKLVEFLPLSGDTWQVYAELNGRVVYRITVPTDARINPTVISLDNGQTVDSPDTPDQTAGESGTSSCSEDLGSLSNKQLTQCLRELAEEMQRRETAKK